MVQDMSGGEERPTEPLQFDADVSRPVEIEGASDPSNMPADGGPVVDVSRIEADPQNLDGASPMGRVAVSATIDEAKTTDRVGEAAVGRGSTEVADVASVPLASVNGAEGTSDVARDSTRDATRDVTRDATRDVASSPVTDATSCVASDITSGHLVDESMQTPAMEGSPEAGPILPEDPSIDPRHIVDGNPRIDCTRATGARTPRRKDASCERADRQDDSQGLFHLPTLHHFTSSFGVDRVLEQLVEKSLRQNRRLDHVLLHGGTGSGTTLVARALVRDLAPNNCVELDVLDGFDAKTLSSAIREVRDGGVLLIRHIEVLDGNGERMLMDCIARKNALGTGRFEPTAGAPRHRRHMKPRLEDVEGIARTGKPIWRPIAANFTLIATAHLTQPIGYQLRCRFDHMIHLRKDPIGTRLAICRALARQGVLVAPDAHPLIERFVDTIGDSAEQLAQAILSRAELEGILCDPHDCVETRDAGPAKATHGDNPPSVVASEGNAGGPDAGTRAAFDWESGKMHAHPDGRTVTRELMHSIIVRDMPCRLPDEVYAQALSLHLAGRRVHRMTDAEVSRIDHETGWGETVVRAALVMILRAQQMRSTRPAA